MSDTTDKDDNSTGGKTLSLRRTVESGHVKQNFSHGRSKNVLVEKKRKRTIGGPAGKADEAAPKAAVQAPQKAESKPAAPKTPKETVDLSGLTKEEQEARKQALADAKVREIEDIEKAKEEEKKRLEREEQEKQELEQAKIKAEEEAARLANAAETPRKKDDKSAKLSTTAPGKDKGKEQEAERKRKEEMRSMPERRSEKMRRRGKLTISNALDDAPRQRSMASIKRRRERERKQQMGAQEPQAKIAREVIIPEVITIQELANRMAERSVDVIKYLMKQGQMVKINDVIDTDTAELIAEEFGHTSKRVSESDVEEGVFDIIEEDVDNLEDRAAVVTVMGHVDHGKTSLLDAFRKANVVSGEAGGITQHIGAYQVTAESGEKITFLDTPGHEAFTAMRARGAKVTDLVVLVVAGDDGVMPQTIEAIHHAKAAEVPLILAINKMDKEASDPTRVRNELLQHEIVVESMGGDVQEVEISALKNQNLDKLMDSILLQAEILELTANPNREASGIVVEARLDKGRGPVATVLVQRGTLSVGDVFVAGSEWGRVRALINDQGDKIETAGPSVPVEILGLNAAPNAGDQFAVVETEAKAREISNYRQRKLRDIKSGGAGSRSSLEQLMSQLKENDLQEVPLVIKADVQGSAEAIIGALDKLATDEVSARVIHSGVGGITESDVSLAKASQAPILGFNVRASAQARDAASVEDVEIRYYNVIYDLVDDIKATMSGMLSPDLKETFLGNAEVLDTFDITKLGRVAGCLITEGVVRRGASVRLIRDSVVIHEGELSTLKRFKDEVKEVASGQECGMGFENYHDIKKGDVIECFTVEEVARSL